MANLFPPTQRLVTEATLDKQVAGSLAKDAVPALAAAQAAPDAVEAYVQQHGLGIVSPAITRILASTDPNEPLDDGDLLLVFAEPFTAVETFAGGISGWTPRWVPSTWAGVNDGTATDGKALALTGAQGRRALSWNLLDAQNATDVELLARAKTTSGSPASFTAGLALRGSGAAGTEHGYIVGHFNGALHVARFINGAYTVITTAAFTAPANTWYWIRFRAEGTQLSVKVWLDGQTEPAGWSRQVTDTGVTGDGFVGVFASLGETTHTWDVVAVALDGATAKVA